MRKFQFTMLMISLLLVAGLPGLSQQRTYPVTNLQEFRGLEPNETIKVGEVVAVYLFKGDQLYRIGTVKAKNAGGVAMIASDPLIKLARDHSGILAMDTWLPFITGADGKFVSREMISPLDPGVFYRSDALRWVKIAGDTKLEKAMIVGIKP